MALPVRRKQQEEALSWPRTFWSPWHAMRDLMRWDPFAEMAAFPAPTLDVAFSPDIEIREMKDQLVFYADVPGLTEKDIEISVSGRQLTISGKREHEEEREGEQFYARERTYGSFSRTFTLPDGVDAENVQAELKNGVLRVSVPKRPELKSKKVEVQTTPRAEPAAEKKPKAA